MSARRPKCPRCGRRKLPVYYGYPADPEVIERAMRGALILGGCCIDPFEPMDEWRCSECERHWKSDAA